MEVVCHRRENQGCGLAKSVGLVLLECFFPMLDNPTNMKRPLGVTVIASFCILAASYLCFVGVATVVAPGEISIINRAPLTYGLRFVNPYVTILVGASWAVVGWGLLRLYNWARWAAMFFSIVGFSSALARIPSASGSGRMLLLLGLHMAVRAAAVWYLFRSPSSICGPTKWQTLLE